MTDAAVIAESAPVSEAPVGGAAINEHNPTPNSPLGSQIPPDARAENQPKEPRSINDSIDRAFERSAAKEAEKAAEKDAKAAPVKAEAKVDPKEQKEPPARGEGGKFAPKAPVAEAPPAAAKPSAEPAKPSFTASEAPSRFSDDAKKEWATAPEAVRRETERAIKELTDGFQKYKGAAERDATLNEFHEMAKASGKELPNVVREYVNMENHLRKDLVGGLDTICQRMGVSLRDVAAHVLNKTPDQQASEQDAVIRELRQQNSTLEQRLSALEGGFRSQQEQSTLTEINKFASENPRFEELADDIALLMKSGRAKDLPEAYQLAERLNPAAASQAKDIAPAASSAAPEPPVQPDKGQKSINGAPSSGLTSQRRKSGPAPSIDEALNRAFGQAG